MHVLFYSFSLLFGLLNFVIFASCTSIDLNRLPPESPQSNTEVESSLVAVEHNVPQFDNSSNLQEIQKGNKRKIINTPEKEVKQVNEKKRKRVRRTYPKELSEKEKKSMRNKEWYAGLSPERKEKRKVYSLLKYQSLTEEGKKLKYRQWRQRQIDRDPEITLKWNAMKRKEYNSYSKEKKLLISQKNRASTLKRLAALTPQERERQRLEKNEKERQRRISMLSTKPKD